jgi:hypothetical protein
LGRILNTWKAALPTAAAAAGGGIAESALRSESGCEVRYRGGGPLDVVQQVAPSMAVLAAAESTARMRSLPRRVFVYLFGFRVEL